MLFGWAKLKQWYCNSWRTLHHDAFLDGDKLTISRLKLLHGPNTAAIGYFRKTREVRHCCFYVFMFLFHIMILWLWFMLWGYSWYMSFILRFCEIKNFITWLWFILWGYSWYMSFILYFCEIKNFVMVYLYFPHMCLCFV